MKLLYLGTKLLPTRARSFVSKVLHRIRLPSGDSAFDSDFYKALSCLKCHVSYNKYGGYCVPDSSRHRPAAKMVLANDVYEPKTIEFMRRECGSGDIIHAGTYFGDFLPALSSTCATDAVAVKVHVASEHIHAASVSGVISGSRAGLRATDPTGSQFRVLPLQRDGFRLRACSLRA